jgi:hypothetical protein
MPAMGSWLLLFALTALAAFAALGITLRAEPEGRAEAGVLWTALFYALIVGPVFALGYTNQLRPWLLAVTSAVVSIAAFVASARGRSLRSHAREVLHAASAMGRLPADAFRMALGARSFVVLGLAGASLALGASAWLTYLAPSESWDGFFYHEPIIGYAIQNHGFRMVDLPPNMVVQGVNGYPRLCEAFALFFVVFADKSLVEIGNTAAAPGLMLATFAIGRRYCKDPVPLMGWAAAALLVPAMLTQLRTSMIDVQVVFFLLAAVHFATRPELRLVDAAAASLCMALVMGSKSSALAWVPPVAVVTYGRLLLAHRRERLGAALAVMAGGCALIAGVAALTFVRNWLAFRNPLWPVSYVNPRLHIDWPGLVTLERISPEPPLREIVRQKYHHPTGGVGDIIARDYGYGVPWIVVPLACVALVVALVVALRARAARSPDARTENLLLVAALGAVFMKVSPSLSIARYNGQVVAIAMISIAWLADRLRDATRLHEGAVASTLVLSLVPWVWTDFFFGLDLTFRDIVALHQHSAAERASMNVATFEMPARVARQRERDLGRGDLVVFTQEMAFPGVLWNQEMSNRVEYVRCDDAATFLARIDGLHPRWVVVGDASPARAALVARSSEWELLGPATKQDQTVVFRRRTM